MIVADGLTKTFGAATALAAVSFSVERGCVLGFLGPNGAGKTTTLRILAGVFPPTSGQVYIAGHDLAREPRAARRQLGYSPERPALHAEMTLRAQLAFVAGLRGVDGGKRTVDFLLERLGLHALADARLGTLSKGTRQRVALALALVGDPPALLLDEPLAGLDPAQSAETRALIRELGRDHAVLVSSHQLADVEVMCDRVVILHQGRVLAEDTPAALATRLRSVVRVEVQATVASGTLAEALATVPGVTRVEGLVAQGSVGRCLVESGPDVDVRPALAMRVVAHGWGLLGLATIDPSLEEAFLALTGPCARS